MTFPFASFRRSYAAVVAFLDTLTANDAGHNGSFRTVTPAITASGTQCRVTFKAGTSGAFNTNNCSVGKSAGSGNTTTTPVELKFNGVSGFSLAASATITSDWVQLPDTVTTADSLVVVMDCGATGNAGYNASSAAGGYFRSAFASYANSSAAGFSFTANNNNGVLSVEVRL